MNLTTRTSALFVSGLILVGGTAACEAAESLSIVSWGGNYTANQSAVFYKPFTAATGIEIKSSDWDGDLGQLRAMKEAGKVTWDVLVGDEYLAKIACDEGLLQKIDPAGLAPAKDGTPAVKDLVPSAIQPCSVGEMVFAAMIGYDPAKFINGEPQNAADFFDLKKFPGKRGLYKKPYSLQIALLADGVPTADIYKVLGTEDGLKRAFAKLNTIKKSVVWWDAYSQPPQLLNDGEVVMTTSSGPRLIQPMVQDHKPWRVLMRDFTWQMDVWMIPAGAPNPKDAQKFIDFASAPERSAALASLAAYSPVRFSANAMVGPNPVSGVNMKPYMLSDPATLADGLKVDADFWADNLDRLTTRFNAWLAE